MNDPSLNEPISGESRGAANDDIDLDRVWVNVAAEVWRRHPGRLERTAARLLRSPGLARALFTTPSLLLPWLIASAVVLAVGALTQVGVGQPLVWLIAPAVAAVGIAYSYGPGLDPAWELSCSMPVSDRLVLLTRGVAVFAVNAVLGLIASAATLGTHASTGTAQLTFAWLLPMTAACALALAVAVAVRSAIAGAGAGVGAWLTLVLGHSATGGAGGGLSAAALTSAITDANLYLPYLAVAACCAVIVLFATRTPRGLHEHRDRRADPDVREKPGGRRGGPAAGPGVFGLLGPNGAGKTTLLRMLATVLPPSSGTLRLLGRDPGRSGRARGDPAPARLPAAEPRLLPVVHRGGVRRVLRAAQGDARRTGCRRRWRPRSSGSTSAPGPGPGCARCPAACCAGSGIAQAIVNDPDLLLLDEPTAGLDPEQRVAFRALLRDLGQHATVVVSTHLVEDVGAACSEVALMDRGQGRVPRHARTN